MEEVKVIKGFAADYDGNEDLFALHESADDAIEVADLNNVPPYAPIGLEGMEGGFKPGEVYTLCSGKSTAIMGKSNLEPLLDVCNGAGKSVGVIGEPLTHADHLALVKAAQSQSRDSVKVVGGMPIGRTGSTKHLQALTAATLAFQASQALDADMRIPSFDIDSIPDFGGMHQLPLHTSRLVTGTTRGRVGDPNKRKANKAKRKAKKQSRNKKK